MCVQSATARSGTEYHVGFVFKLQTPTLEYVKLTSFLRVIKNHEVVSFRFIN